MRTFMLAALVVAVGCRSPKPGTDGDTIDSDGLSETPDADGDGYNADDDCDDNNSLVNPGAVELCDGFDNDCDDIVDEDVTTTFYADADGDGFGDPELPVEACEQPDGYVPIGNDCDDSTDLTFPGAGERCDGQDNDCDGEVDEDLLEEWYLDSDADGYGDPSSRTDSCDPGDDYVADSTDCDDTNTDVNPGGEEVCNEIDDDCDGATDEDVTTTYYADTDADGYGISDKTTEACEAPTGWAADPGDCDDASADVNPSAAEVCNEIDDDCDGATDEGVTSTYYADADSDGYGDASDATDACTAPSGYVSDATDCDDGESAANPGAPEVCDEIDNDCDGATDEGVTTTYYADDDGDSFGDASDATEACTVPAGHVSDATDCDDSNGAINPDGEEVCDSADNDCDGTVDEDDATDASTWYADDDGDSYGDAGDSTEACEAPSGYVSDATDCDDASSDVNPSEAEACNEIDDDCDGSVDEGVTTTYYADADSDGYGDAGTATEACEAPSGYTDDDTDCDDSNGDINPDGEEVCNGSDDDCDGATDEGAADPETWYADGDGDGYGDADDTTEACEEPSGYTDDDTDCDDSDGSIHPGASEACNGEDDDCDGTEDDGVLGTGAACAADSCLDILTDDSSAGDGDYWVWFDTTETETECDMTTDGGGWTLIFADDFESTPDSGWSLSSRYTCGSWSTLLGGYGIIAGGEIDITVSTYSISHSEAWVDMEYMSLDSWDGESAYVDFGGATVWSRSQNNHSSSYSEVCGWNRGTNGSYDSMHAVSEIVSHTGSNVELIAGSSLDQDSTDESFGLDDVTIWIR